MKETKMSKKCNTHRTEWNLYRIFVGKSKSERSLRITGHRWEIDIKINLKNVRWGGVDWTVLL
jgi:hypothetical protein